MYTSTIYWGVLLACGTLFAAQPPAPPRPPAPAEAKSAGPLLDDSALPSPRLASPPPTANPIVEEPAPAPHEQRGGAFPVLPPRPFHEEAAPIPHMQTLPPARFSMPQAPRDPFLPEVEALHREVERLRREREAMSAEEMDLIASKDLRSAKNSGASLRMHVAELLAKVALQARKEKETASAPKKRSEDVATQATAKENLPSSSPHAPSPTHPLSPQTAQNTHPSASAKPPDIPKQSAATKSEMVTDAPVDPLALAQSLFRAGDYTAALNAYRKLDTEDQKPEDRIVIQYMMACCLRKLGKVDEASVLYREAANSPGNDFLMENAQWYLRTMKDRRELEAQLGELRERREAVKSRKQ